MEIVCALAEHQNAVYDLICELEGKAIDKTQFELAFLHNITNEDIYYLLAIENDVLLGFASLHIQLLLHHAGTIGEIQEFIVDHKSRGQGVGMMLYQGLKQIAMERGCVSFEVSCNQSRKESHSFYINRGMGNTHHKFTLPLI